MMTSTFLSREEVSILTGLTQPAAQTRWLRSHGWLFEISASGKPQVARSFFVSRMVQPMKSESPPTEAEQPDMTALLTRIRRRQLDRRSRLA